MKTDNINTMDKQFSIESSMFSNRFALLENDKKVIVLEHYTEDKKYYNDLIINGLNQQQKDKAIIDKLVLALNEVTKSYEDHVISTGENTNDFIYITEANKLLKEIEADKQ